jgi:hypothetical protein
VQHFAKRWWSLSLLLLMLLEPWEHTTRLTRERVYYATGPCCMATLQNRRRAPRNGFAKTAPRLVERPDSAPHRAVGGDAVAGGGGGGEARRPVRHAHFGDVKVILTPPCIFCTENHR